jgi:hypothetical protein
LEGEDDDLDDEDRDRLRAAFAASEADVAAGNVRDAVGVIAELRPPRT